VAGIAAADVVAHFLFASLFTSWWVI
jgi:hypothetical protein